MNNASNTTFKWADFDSWYECVINITSDLLIEAVIAKCRLAHPRDIFSPGFVDLEWLEVLLIEVNPDYSGNGFEFELAERLANHYTTIRAFHACAPIDIAPYYEKGLLPLNPEVVANQVKRMFLNGDYPELTEDQLDKVISEKSLDSSDEEVFFNLNERFLIEHCSHYLLYGSENICDIAVELGRAGGRDYTQHLKGRGTPTMFVCDIPWEMISGETQIELTREITINVLRRLLSSSFIPSLGEVGFSIKEPLPPKYISHHYHPENIKDA